MNKVICIDIDNTVCNTTPKWMSIVEAFVSQHKPNFVIKNSNNFLERFGFDTDKDFHEFFKSKRIEINNETVFQYELISGAKEKVEKLKNMGFEIHFVTARMDDGYGDATAISKKWLDFVGMPYDVVIGNVQNKGEYCKKVNALVHIDDSSKFCLQAANEGIKAVLFLNKNNLKEEIIPNNPYVKTARNWNEIFNQIISIDQKKSPDMEF